MSVPHLLFPLPKEWVLLFGLSKIFDHLIDIPLNTVGTKVLVASNSQFVHRTCKLGSKSMVELAQSVRHSTRTSDYAKAGLDLEGIFYAVPDLGKPYQESVVLFVLAGLTCISYRARSFSIDTTSVRKPGPISSVHALTLAQRF